MNQCMFDYESIFSYAAFTWELDLHHFKLADNPGQIPYRTNKNPYPSLPTDLRWPRDGLLHLPTWLRSQWSHPWGSTQARVWFQKHRGSGHDWIFHEWGQNCNMGLSKYPYAVTTRAIMSTSPQLNFDTYLLVSSAFWTVCVQDWYLSKHGVVTNTVYILGLIHVYFGNLPWDLGYGQGGLGCIIPRLGGCRPWGTWGCDLDEIGLRFVKILLCIRK